MPSHWGLVSAYEFGGTCSVYGTQKPLELCRGRGLPMSCDLWWRDLQLILQGLGTGRRVPSFSALLLLSWLQLVPPKEPEGRGAWSMQAVGVSLPGHRAQWKRMGMNLKGNQRAFSASPFRFLNSFYPVDGTSQTADEQLCHPETLSLGIRPCGKF